MTKSEELAFDTPPIPQHKKSNFFTIGLQLFGFTVFLIMSVAAWITLQNEPEMRILSVGCGSFMCLLSILAAYEGFSELQRIDQIERLLNGRRKDRDQLIIGTYAGENVNFYISKEPCINYALQINGHKALPCKQAIKQFIKQKLKETGLPDHKIRLTESGLILSRFFAIAFQINPPKALTCYDVLIKTKKQFDL